jgi:hypothetical protein
MAKKPLPTPDELRQLLRYEPDTGLIIRLAKGKNRETPALFSLGRNGHLGGYVGGRQLSAHRVAFALYHGRWPERFIDHIDGNPANNAISNLRECSHRENMCNRRPAKGATSRFLGVSYERRRQNWRAEIRKNGKAMKLGTFACEISAARAYDEAARKIHGSFARLNFP